MWKLFQIELYKIFKRPRTYIAFGVITVMILVIQLGLKIDGEAYIDFLFSSVKQSLDFEGRLLNGYFVCYIILQLLLVHVPLLIALIAADMVSGEANMGTLRMLLTKPVSRTEFILAKLLASGVYTFLLLAWIAVLALGVSIALFGTGDFIHAKNNYIVQLVEADVLWRYIGAFSFALLSMLTVTALGFFLSIFADNSIGPIVATIGIIIVFTILSTMSIPLYQKIQPYLFTTHMVTWKEFFDEKVNENNEAIIGSIQNPRRIFNSAVVLCIHIIGFVIAATAIFKKKDVLS